MLLRGWKGGLPGLLLLLPLLCVSARPAAAMGLDVSNLNVVSSFTLDNATTGDPLQDPVIVVGDVAYSDWDVLGIMGLDSDLSQYTVSATATGIRITGPFESTGWSTLELGFNVNSISGAILASASLDTAVEASAGGSGGVDPETLLQRGLVQVPIDGLQAIVSGGNGTASDFADISGAGLTDLRVYKKITADFDGEGAFARVLYVDQGFTTVPEPGSLALVALGLAGLARLGRRRS